jgi:competence protein CoiA
MMLARLDSQIRTAEPKLAGATCPLCDGPVVPKCGEVNVWHWAHRTADCDPWAEPISQWHLSWQELAPKERREVVIGNHRADIVTPRGVVVEIQRSHLSVQAIAEREAHYGAMVWIFDAREAAGPNAGARWTSAGGGGSWVDECEPRLHIRNPKRPDSPLYRTFRWKHARKSITACRQTTFLDIGCDQLLLLGKIYPDAPVGGWGHIWTREQVAAAINEPFTGAA